MASIQALRKRIREADAAYRDGLPVMSDADFDALTAELRRVAPHAPELHTPGGGTALLSLDSAADTSDLSSWYATTLSGLAAEQRCRAAAQLSCVIQPKIDGVSLGLRYVLGANATYTLEAAWTRSGRCALAIATLSTTIPKRLRFAVEQLRLLSPAMLSLPMRITVAGELWGLDGAQSTPAVALRRAKPTQRDAARLSFAAYRISSAAAPLCSDELSSLDLLSSVGFLSTPTLLSTDLAQITHSWHAWLSRTADPHFNTSVTSLCAPYPTDGLVTKLLSHSDQELLGCTAKAPRWALALKR